VSDQEVLDDATQTVERYCAAFDGVAELDRQSAQQALEAGAIEEDWILHWVEQGASIVNASLTVSEMLSDAISQYTDPTYLVDFVLAKAIVTVMALVVLALWLLTCWWCVCPCFCKCFCCCFQKQWKTGKIFRATVWLLFLSIVGVTLYMFISSAMGGESIELGIQGVACSGASLAQDVISGVPDEQFLGVVPLFRGVQNLSRVLDDNSNFMTSLTAIIDQTQDIEKAVNLVTETLGVLEAILSHSDNMEPTKSGSTLYHTCAICGPLASVLSEMRTVFADSTGRQVAELRTTINDQLQGEFMDSVRSALAQASPQIDDAQAVMLDWASWLVRAAGGNESSFQDIVAPVVNQELALPFAALGFFALYVPLLIAALVAMIIWTCTDHPREEPPRCCVRCCTGCVSCTACFYAFWALLIAGIPAFLSTILGGMCVFGINLDSETASNLLNLTGYSDEVPADVQTEAFKLMDRCFSLQYDLGADSSLNLADIVEIPSQNETLRAMGQGSTVRQELYSLAIDPIRKQIDDAEASYSGNFQLLAEDPKLLELMSMIGSLDMEALYFPDEAKISADTSPYQEMTSTATMNPNPFAAYLAVALPCNSVTLSADLGADYGGQQVPGLNEMVERGFTLQGATVPPLNETFTAYSWSCPSLSSFACPSLPGDPRTAACTATGQFIQNTKTVLVTERRFRCINFANPDGSKCNPANMVKTGTTWSGTCELPSGRFTRRTASCNIQELQANIKEFEDDLRAVFVYFDDVIAQLVDKIIIDLKNLVQAELIDPAVNLVDNLNCGFVRNFWQGLADNVCYRGIGGFRAIAHSYVLSGVLSFCIGVNLFLLWKVTRDQKDRWGEGTVSMGSGCCICLRPRSGKVNLLDNEGSVHEIGFQVVNQSALARVAPVASSLSMRSGKGSKSKPGTEVAVKVHVKWKVDLDIAMQENYQLMKDSGGFRKKTGLAVTHAGTMKSEASEPGQETPEASMRRLLSEAEINAVAEDNMREHETTAQLEDASPREENWKPPNADEIVAIDLDEAMAIEEYKDGPGDVFLRTGALVEYWSQTHAKWLPGTTICQGITHADTPDLPSYTLSLKTGVASQLRHSVPLALIRRAFAESDEVSLLLDDKEGWRPGVIIARSSIPLGYRALLTSGAASETVVEVKAERVRQRFPDGSDVVVFRGLDMGWKAGVVRCPDGDHTAWPRMSVELDDKEIVDVFHHLVRRSTVDDMQMQTTSI